MSVEDLSAEAYDPILPMGVHSCAVRDCRKIPVPGTQDKFMYSCKTPISDDCIGSDDKVTHDQWIKYSNAKVVLKELRGNLRKARASRNEKGSDYSAALAEAKKLESEKRDLEINLQKATVNLKKEKDDLAKATAEYEKALAGQTAEARATLNAEVTKLREANLAQVASEKAIAEAAAARQISDALSAQAVSLQSQIDAAKAELTLAHTDALQKQSAVASNAAREAEAQKSSELAALQERLEANHTESIKRLEQENGRILILQNERLKQEFNSAQKSLVAEYAASLNAKNTNARATLSKKEEEISHIREEVNAKMSQQQKIHEEAVAAAERRLATLTQNMGEELAAAAAKLGTAMQEKSDKETELNELKAQSNASITELGLARDTANLAKNAAIAADSKTKQAFTALKKAYKQQLQRLLMQMQDLNNNKFIYYDEGSLAGAIGTITAQKDAIDTATEESINSVITSLNPVLNKYYEEADKAFGKQDVAGAAPRTDRFAELIGGKRKTRKRKVSKQKQTKKRNLRKRK